MMIAAILLSLATAAPPATPPAPELPAWLAGCWVTDGATRQTEECWTAPHGSMLLGSSQTYDVGGDTRNFEHMRIAREAGQLVLIAHPGGAQGSRFPLAEQGAEDGRPYLLFVNRDHDYPQRIRYWLTADGALVGEIALADGSQPMHWTYRRR